MGMGNHAVSKNKVSIAEGNCHVPRVSTGVATLLGVCQARVKGLDDHRFKDVPAVFGRLRTWVLVVVHDMTYPRQISRCRGFVVSASVGCFLDPSIDVTMAIV